MIFWIAKTIAGIFGFDVSKVQRWVIVGLIVLIAAAAVWALGSAWPDIIVGTLICVLFLRSAFAVTREARTELLVHRNAT